jgi:hypothetical protein
MAIRRQLLLGLSLTMFVGCAHTFTLTTGGTKVKLVEHSALPDGCRVIADVSIGIPPDAAVANSEAELSILFRNKAADMGADHVVVEQTEQRPGADGINHYVGSASAYACTPVATSGGEEPAGEEPAAEEPAAE